MAKQTGLGDNLYVAGRDLSGDTGSIGTIGGGPTTLDLTDISQSAMDRLGGLRDGRLEFSAFFNDAAGRAHPTLSALPTTDVQVMYFRGTSLGGQAAAMVGKQVNYDPTRGSDGSLTIAVSAVSNSFGLEWGRSLTAGKRSDSSATNGTGVDFAQPLAGSSTFGLQAYLQVFSFSGTSCTVTLQESSDNGSSDSFGAVTGGAFAAASAVGAQRIATASGQTVERYLRAVTSGTFSECTFAVVVNRNDTATVF
jgi:hypothetical protein